MKQTISYDDEEIMAIKSECAEAIADFGMQFHIIQEFPIMIRAGVSSPF